MRQLLTNARLICPAQKQDETGWLLIEDGVIADSGTGANGKDITADKVTDCAGQIVGPGFVDMRVQSGYPGAEHLETLDSLLQAAAAGGRQQQPAWSVGSSVSGMPGSSLLAAACC
ncbi:MAG: hypothetical protein VXW11_06175 [Pseudomonadota bacterium]|nr:hypothetical protein [Pseudomonadota bacterium]